MLRSVLKRARQFPSVLRSSAAAPSAAVPSVPTRPAQTSAINMAPAQAAAMQMPQQQQQQQQPKPATPAQPSKPSVTLSQPRMPEGTHVSFIGGGAMAQAIASGVVRSKLLPTSSISISDQSPSRKGVLGDLINQGVFVSQDNKVVASRASVIIMAVKPDVTLPVLQEIMPHLRKDALIVSIAAGLTLQRIEAVLPQGTRVIRVMPNTPSSVREGTSAYSLGKSAREEDAKAVHTLFSSIGLAVQTKEKEMNGVIGVSGSGPAYVCLFVEALADGGVRAGLTRDAAMKLAIQTVLGSSKLMQQSGRHPAQLKDAVASPGGTTIAAIHALEEGGFRSTVMDAVMASANRAGEMEAASAKAAAEAEAAAAAAKVAAAKANDATVDQ